MGGHGGQNLRVLAFASFYQNLAPFENCHVFDPGRDLHPRVCVQTSQCAVEGPCSVLNACSYRKTVLYSLNHFVTKELFCTDDAHQAGSKVLNLLFRPHWGIDLSVVASRQTLRQLSCTSLNCKKCLGTKKVVALSTTGNDLLVVPLTPSPMSSTEGQWGDMVSGVSRHSAIGAVVHVGPPCSASSRSATSWAYPAMSIQLSA